MGKKHCNCEVITYMEAIFRIYYPARCVLNFAVYTMGVAVTCPLTAFGGSISPWSCNIQQLLLEKRDNESCSPKHTVGALAPLVLSALGLL